MCVCCSKVSVRLAGRVCIAGLINERLALMELMSECTRADMRLDASRASGRCVSSSV